MKLRQQISEKEALISRSQKFNPITSCSLTLWGDHFNIHTMTVETAILVRTYLNALINSANELGVSPKINGYVLSSWMTDVEAKLDNLLVASERTKLRNMKAQLEALLSKEKQTELLIDDIESALK